MNCKIKTLGELGTICTAHKQNGEKVVLCHGCFDLVHIGHLRHFESAKNHGDILVVTITGDAFVNKGPNRPAFSAEMRCEMLAAMEVVDYVAVVENPSAISCIAAVKPDIYVKGREYDIHADITGKMELEVQAVEDIGGQVIYTDDITFSSSNLINSYLDVMDEPLRAYVNAFKANGKSTKIDDCMKAVSELKVLVLGETIIDEYQYVSTLGKAAKENIISTQFSDMERFGGGVIAAANHITSLCAKTDVMTLIGDGSGNGMSMRDSFKTFIRESLDDCAALSFVVRPNAPTIRKIRFVEPTYTRKLFSICHLDDSPLPHDVQAQFKRDLREKIKTVDAVIVCDFGHGFIDSEIVAILQEESPFLAINVQSNSANTGYNLLNKYKRADFVCIDATEARLAAQDKHSEISYIISETIPSIIDAKQIIVTHGKNGCYAFDPSSGAPVHVPAMTKTVVDTMGAGDAFFVTASLFFAVGSGSEIAAFIGSVAGSLEVGVVGHRTSNSKLLLQRSMTSILK